MFDVPCGVLPCEHSSLGFDSSEVKRAAWHTFAL